MRIFFSFMLFFLVLNTSVYAQGIAVQGIARDNSSAAIKSVELPFTFSIVDGNNPVYVETKTIKTDAFGVFSHIVSNGTATKNTFEGVDFSKENLKIKIQVDYNGTAGIVVYEKEFQYTPYAHYAKKAKEADYAKKAKEADKALHGVPTGTIIAYAGKTAPEGWLMCNGDDIPTGDEYQALREIMATNTTPDLRGRFLRGAGTGAGLDGDIDPVNVQEKQGDEFKSHSHTAKGGRYYANNSDPYGLRNDGNSTLDDDTDFSSSEPNLLRTSQIYIDIPEKKTYYAGGTETRPYNYGVNYIIKY